MGNCLVNLGRNPTANLVRRSVTGIARRTVEILWSPLMGESQRAPCRRIVTKLRKIPLN